MRISGCALLCYFAVAIDAAQVALGRTYTAALQLGAPGHFLCNPPTSVVPTWRRPQGELFTIFIFMR